MCTALLLVLALAQLPDMRAVFDLGMTHDVPMFDAFNRGYDLAVSGSVYRAEVMTEFRRAVLIVHEQSGRGNSGYTVQELTAVLAPVDGQVSFIVEVRINPLNTFVRPPSYELYVETGPATPPLGAKPFARDPVYPPGFGRGSPMSGIRLEASFARSAVEAAAAPTLILMDDHANIVWKARIDLARYR